MTPVLHTYFRSTASWRVRIALGLKEMGYEAIVHHLRKGEHRDPAYLALNPQGLLPTLELDNDRVLTQSLAICEYLDEMQSAPRLLPTDPYDRARVRAFAQIIACDVHPVQNLKILERLRTLGLDDDQVERWARITIEEGLDACECLLTREDGHFCFGDVPSLADICLVPQLGNARRFGVDLRWRRFAEIEARCNALPAFRNAAPASQRDAE